MLGHEKIGKKSVLTAIIFKLLQPRYRVPGLKTLAMMRESHSAEKWQQ